MEKRKLLSELLDADETLLDRADADNGVEVGPEDELDTDAPEGYCTDCKDMPTQIRCETCSEDFCGICFALVHKGKRKEHVSHKVESGLVEPGNGGARVDAQEEDTDLGIDAANPVQSDHEIDERILRGMRRNIQYIPMRLSAEERQLLRLLESALHVSEYTDRVDVLSYKSKTRRQVEQLREICSILAGLVVASNLKVGQRLIEDKNFEDNAEWYQNVFEIGRRYKIMNPERMRDSFGKLCYMVMDSRLPEVQEHMEFDLYKPIKTIHSFLSSRDDGGKGLKIFEDPLVLSATAEIRAEGKPRLQIRREIGAKEAAIEKIANKYSCAAGFTKEEIRQVLYSVGDFNAYTNANMLPVIRMSKLLELFEGETGKHSLGIRFGRGGARLSHEHDRQIQYVRQSLSLWTLIMKEMIHLWSLADDDMFSSGRYQLMSTGQGLNRVKPCPSVLRTMHTILSECQKKCNGWVGSSAIHLGDHTVPNALFFLDKYFQVPRILIPVDQALRAIDEVTKNDHFVADYVNAQFGSSQDLKKEILADFFRHAFDGSGGDNFYDAGSCIDGRLTSAWNWANKIGQKEYYKVFLLSGFIGFNGLEGF
ncbi:unnamed protein product [Kuraishia capsulata CBS 1993]|uniref:Non-canonical E2 ubiquitin-conjugating enzyme C-terminal domain-containing protein n=1 Tax=Kuraishia capsulata CBS 1993 TaxID=1382522 RepID=W6MIW9_9ASCO|nr:uncharacterized protein KUCA_T00002092001 [Kuraishia capsulata CBS 1993]CDK26121.1 unnamed protein product [Kuraishia capsulata CBS 1993]